MRKPYSFLLFLVFSLFLKAQAPEKPASTDIYEKVQKLNFLGSAMYIAAHPDDENTRLIAYLANHIKAQTAYLSLTRGDGGQNLIGPELRELLGVLRTQELLAARRVDRGKQLFSRANDFGFSKHPDETLSIWDKSLVMSDMIRAIRTFKPDVIINRFDHRTPGSTHGHHTASAMMSFEAFDIAGNPSKYKNTGKPWQPKRLFFNTSWWFYGGRENFEKADKSNMLSVDVGVYYPLKGRSNNEIAALASSQHLCQGFGRLSTRGSQPEYIELLKGDLPKDKNNIFDGINTTWTRVQGGKAIGAILEDVEQNFSFKDPATHIPKLMEAYQLIETLEDEHWKTIKLKEIKDIIVACSGLYLEATANDASTYPGGTVTVALEALNRSDADIALKSIAFNNGATTFQLDKELKNNQKVNEEKEVMVTDDSSFTSPYWLLAPSTLGMYTVADEALIGKPETPRNLIASIAMSIHGKPIDIEREVVCRYSKPDKGELYKPFEVLPKVTASIPNKVNIFANGASKEVPVTIKAGKADLSGSVKLAYPNDWQVSPSSIAFDIKNKGEEKIVSFTVTPPSAQSEGKISPIVEANGKSYTHELVEIGYEHIPFQSVLLPSEAKVVKLDIQKAGENIGYIAGAGDAIPESLKQIGYNVVTIAPEEIDKTDLEKFDAIVLGIRAYNVVDALKFKQPHLLDYVQQGGTMIVQYNTSGRWRKTRVMAPFDLKISRDRVTDENAPVSIIANGHSLVNFPNKITEKDFDGWVQERGLYFPNEWSDDYTPILSTNDKGESAKTGSLLVAKYGEGHYIYTGLSFFRELPAGVPGAYRLFTNMLSIGKNQVSTKKVKG